MNVTCFYHDDCVDGFAAMWAVKKRYPEAECYPVDYNKPPPFYPKGYLIIVDFTFPDVDEMKKLIDTASYVHHFDHHAGAEELVSTLKATYYGTGSYYAIFDLKRSGAGITWDYLQRTDRPEFISLVEDRDLWRFRFEDTEAFGVAIRNAGFDLSAYEYAATEEGVNHFITVGMKEHEEKMARIRQNIAATQRSLVLEVPLEISEYQAVTTVCSRAEDRHDASEQCHEMLRKSVVMDYAVCWWPNDGGIRLRISSRDDGPSVIPIAKHYGGGGHLHASGVQLPIDHPVSKDLLQEN